MPRTKTPENEAFGQLVREHRDRQGLTQAQLGEVIDLDQRNITSVENGYDGLSVWRFVTVIDHLEIPWSDVVKAFTTPGHPDKTSFMYRPSDLLKHVCSSRMTGPSRTFVPSAA